MVAIGLTDYHPLLNHDNILTTDRIWNLYLGVLALDLGGFLKLLSIARKDYLRSSVHEDITCFTPPDSEVVFPERPRSHCNIVTQRCHRLTPFSHSSPE
jgi:hypothetical protein